MRYFVLVLGLMLIGCDKGEPAASAPSAAPATWLVSSAPGDAVDVKAAKAQVKEGDIVTVRGKIGGRMEPITGESGLFVMMDPAVPSCADLHADACKTPWDYCCEAPESITANAATVQVIGDDGEPAALGGRLSPLDEVIVTGEVQSRDNDKTLIIRATEVYVAPRGGGAS